MTFTIKQGDTSPPLTTTLADAGVPIDLSSTSNIQFIMEDPFARTVIEDDRTGNVNIVSEADGLVEYIWQDGDTDTAGAYRAEWIVEYDTGTSETFPVDGYLGVEVVEGLDD